jgi:hypothetical protein
LLYQLLLYQLLLYQQCHDRVKFAKLTLSVIFDILEVGILVFDIITLLIFAERLPV